MKNSNRTKRSRRIRKKLKKVNVNRFRLSMEQPAQTSTVQGATEIDPDLLDPNFLESDLVDV